MPSVRIQTASSIPSPTGIDLSSATMAANIAIPRFLLPQSSWKLACVPPQAVAKSIPRHLPSSPFPHRSLTTQARLFQQPIAIRPRTHDIHRSSIQCTAQSPLAVTARAFSTTQTRPRDHHFDTLKFVQRLKDEGFSEEQSKAMMLVLSDVIEESIQNLTRTMVLREGASFSPSPPLSRALCLPYFPQAIPLSLTCVYIGCRCRPQHLHPKSRLHKAPLRTPSTRLQRNKHHNSRIRASEQRHRETLLAGQR